MPLPTVETEHDRGERWLSLETYLIPTNRLRIQESLCTLSRVTHVERDVRNKANLPHYNADIKFASYIRHFFTVL